MDIDSKYFNPEYSLESLGGPRKIVVGMSGGVDSSVTAALLKAQGHHVIGMFMKNWDEQNEHGECQAAKEYKDVISVCEKLNIPYYSMEFVSEYWENVFEDFLREYRKGNTPNPDILCNREIKFKVFFEQAKKLGAEFLATGHYCQRETTDNSFSLVKGLDQNKDQTYFLYTIQSEVLENVLFPIGHLEKSEVREIAQLLELSTSAKKDSTGICFIGERNFRQFLSNYIAARPGNFVNLNGEVVGEHLGVAYYTLGQRKGLGLGGPGEPWYVVAKDVEKNHVVVERGDKHPALFSDYCLVEEISWVGPSPLKIGESFRCMAKARYRQRDQACKITLLENGELRVDFDNPQRSLTPGQSVVFYLEKTCLGGGMINFVGPSYFVQQKALPEVVAI